MDLKLRRATDWDAVAVSALYLRARKAAKPTIPMTAHTDDDTRRWIAERVIPDTELWVAERQHAEPGETGEGRAMCGRLRGGPQCLIEWIPADSMPLFAAALGRIAVPTAAPCPDRCHRRGPRGRIRCGLRSGCRSCR